MTVDDMVIAIKNMPDAERRMVLSALASTCGVQIITDQWRTGKHAPKTHPKPQGEQTAWRYDALAREQREWFDRRFPEPTVEALRKELLLLRIAVYPIAGVLGAVDTEGHPRYGHVRYYSDLFPYNTDDSEDSMWDSDMRAIPPTRLLEWTNAGDVMHEDSLQWNGPTLHDSVELLGASGSDLAAGIHHGFISVFEARNLDAVCHGGVPRVDVEGNVDADPSHAHWATVGKVEPGPAGTPADVGGNGNAGAGPDGSDPALGTT